MRKIYVEIPGNPLPQLRLRHFTRNGKSTVYDPKSREKARIRLYLKNYVSKKFQHYVFPKFPKISIIFYMNIPVSMPKKEKIFAVTERMKHTKKPDADNLLKLYLDCINDILILDDRETSFGNIVKIYSENPRTAIVIEESTETIDDVLIDYFKPDEHSIETKWKDDFFGVNDRF